MAQDKLTLRKFNDTIFNKQCNDKCPFLNCNYCNLYNEYLEDVSYRDGGFKDYIRCKLCINNIKPNNKSAIIKELKKINRKLDIIINYNKKLI